MEDDNYCYTATYLDLEQVICLQLVVLYNMKIGDFNFLQISEEEKKQVTIPNQGYLVVDNVNLHFVILQVDHLQSLLSPTRAAPLATSDMHQLTPSSMEPLPVPASFKTAAMKFQGSCQQNKSLHGTSPGLSASEDETGNKRQRYEQPTF